MKEKEYVLINTGKPPEITSRTDLVIYCQAIGDGELGIGNQRTSWFRENFLRLLGVIIEYEYLESYYNSEDPTGMDYLVITYPQAALAATIEISLSCNPVNDSEPRELFGLVDLSLFTVTPLP